MLTYVGSYTGNGDAGGQTISAPGFQPDWVIIKQHNNAVDGVHTHSSLAANSTHDMQDFAATGVAGIITSLTSTGFTVGNTTRSNTLNSLYGYVCVKFGSAGDAEIVSWVGDNASTRNISHNLGVVPNFIFCHDLEGGSGREPSFWRSNLMSGDFAANFENDSAQTGLFTANPTNSVFQVGLRLNDSGITYYAILFKNTTDCFETFSYAGNSSDDRNLPALDLTPLMANIHRPTQDAMVRFDDWPTGVSVPWHFNNIANCIQDFNVVAKSIQVGNDTRVNVTGNTYHGFAFGTGDSEAVPAVADGVATLPSLLSSAIGEADFVGTSIITLPSLIASGLGIMQPEATAVVALPSLTASGSALMQPEAIGVVTLPSLSAIGDAFISIPTGDGITTLPNLTASGIAVHEQTATGIVTLPALVASGTATHTIIFASTGVPGLPALVASGVAKHKQTSSGSGTLGSLTAYGFDWPFATAALSLPKLNASAVGVMQASGVASPSLQRLSAAGSALEIEDLSGTAAVSLGALTALASADNLGFPFITSPDINIELVTSGAATSANRSMPIEVTNGGTPFSISFTMNIEVLEDASQAGQPEVILSLIGAQASRLRAELFDWNVRTRSQGPISSVWLGTSTAIRKQRYVDEFIGKKNGVGPILNISNFEYTWLIDGIGTWSATLPAITPEIASALDATSQIIKFYLEGVGHFFTGWISEHEFNESGTLTITGYDMGIFLARHNSFYRHEIAGGSSRELFPWAAAQVDQGNPYILNFGPNSGWLPWTFDPQIIDPGTGELVGGAPIPPVKKRFQSQSVIEMWQELAQVFGTHWRINPLDTDVYIDAMGNDSGKIVQVVQEDDPQAIEEGVLVIDSLTYGKTDDEVINSELSQGSNNAFGVSVELRHSTLQDKIGYYSGTPWSEVSFPQWSRSDELRGWEVTASDTDNFSSELGFGASNEFIQSPEIFAAFKQNISFGAEFDFAWAATFGYRQMYRVLFESGTGLTLRFDLFQGLNAAPLAGAIPFLSVHLGNVTTVSDLPEVNDVVVEPSGLVRKGDRPDISLVNGSYTPGGDKVHFSEIIFIPSQSQGFVRIPPGSYTAVVSIGYAGGAFSPHLVSTHLESWVCATRQGSSSFWLRHLGGNTFEWVEQKGFRPFLEISGRYNTASSKAKYPYIIMGQFAAGIDDTLATSGRRIFYIRNDDSIEKFGLREKVISFQNAVDSRQGLRDIKDSANVLYSSGAFHLSRHSDRFELISFSTIGALNLPKPGEKVRVVFRGYAEVDGGVTEGENRKYTWVDINDLYWIISININITDDGIRHVFTVASVPENLLDPAAIPYEMRRAIHRHNNYMAEIEYGTHVGIIPEEF
jgi:hypothetical protein